MHTNYESVLSKMNYKTSLSTEIYKDNSQETMTQTTFLIGSQVCQNGAKKMGVSKTQKLRKIFKRNRSKNGLKLILNKPNKNST